MALFALYLATPSLAQLGGGIGIPRVGGPLINDTLPGRIGGGLNGRAGIGPRIGMRNPIGHQASNALGALTSIYTTFDNGYFMTKFGADSGLGNMGFLPRGGIAGSLRGLHGTLGESMRFGLGPVTFSNFEVGAGMFYTDLDTPTGVQDDSGWASVITLASNVSVVTPIFALSARAQAYYLPFEDDWGWGTPGPFASFGIQGFWDPGMYYMAAFRAQIGEWELIAYDIFTGDYVGNNIADAFFDDPSIGTVGVVGPASGGFDGVGRYGFGGAYADRQPDASSRLQFPRFSNRAGSYFNSDRMLFVNSAGVVAGRLLSPTSRNVNWFRRDDYWVTSSFRNSGNYMTGGTLFDMAGSQYVSPFATYEFGTFDEFQTLQNTFRAGSWGLLSDSIGYSLTVGYYWTSGTRNDRGTGLADLFMMHYVGSRFMQYLGFGRGVTDPTFGERFVNDYVQYGLSYMIKRGVLAQIVTGYYQTDGDLTQTSSFDAGFAGMRLRMMVTDRSFLSISSIAERYDFASTGEETNQWIHRLIYGIMFSKKTTGFAGYQYIDRHSNIAAASFTEHLLLFYLVHRF